MIKLDNLDILISLWPRSKLYGIYSKHPRGAGSEGRVWPQRRNTSVKDHYILPGRSSWTSSKAYRKTLLRTLRHYSTSCLAAVILYTCLCMCCFFTLAFGTSEFCRQPPRLIAVYCEVKLWPSTRQCQPQG